MTLDSNTHQNTSHTDDLWAYITPILPASSGRIIQLLPELLISQIAAGEVIERPASIIKELMENAIDAQAKNIDIRLENGGMTHIWIKDDGCGMTPDMLPLSLQRHATSKVYDLHELERVHTLGFRGEALASIASVAYVSIQSRTAAHEYGHQIAPDARTQVYQCTPCSMDVGTQISVKDIFFRTPARRKFLKSAATELAHCLECIQRLALLHPHIAIRVAQMDTQKILLDWPAQTLNARVESFLEKQKIGQVDSLLPVLKAQRDQAKLLAFIQNPQYAHNKPVQHSVVNGRWVKDKIIQKALKQAYSDVSHGHQQASWVVYLQVPDQDIDVNVHPHKTELRWRDGGPIYQWLYKTVQQHLAKPDHRAMVWTPRIANFPASNAAPDTSAGVSTSDQRHSIDTHRAQQNLQALSQDYHIPLDALAVLQPAAAKTQNVPLPLNTGHQTLGNSDFSSSKLHFEQPRWPFKHAENAAQENCGLPLGFAIGHLHTTYILAQNHEGLLVIDMHAAHERVIYEQLKKNLQQKKVEQQVLLVPHILALNPVQHAMLVDHMPTWQHMGFEFDMHADGDGGGDSANADAQATYNIAIVSIPVILQKLPIVTMVQQALDAMHHCGAEAGADFLENQRDKILSSIACHGALRAHDTTNIAQMNMLLRQMETTLRSAYCNHGRPTWRIFPLGFFDDVFKRGE